MILTDEIESRVYLTGTDTLMKDVDVSYKWKRNRTLVKNPENQ